MMMNENAAGEVSPPLIIYWYVRVPQAIFDHFPSPE